MSNSARAKPLSFGPPVSEISVIRCSISIGGSGNCALPGPNICPCEQVRISSYVKLDFLEVIKCRSLNSVCEPSSWFS